MKARELIRRRTDIADGAIADVVVWTVPRPVDGCAHLFKYRLAFVVDDVCVIRYDNERGKGDHLHYGRQEVAYLFSSPRQLIADFFEDIARWRNERGHD